MSEVMDGRALANEAKRSLKQRVEHLSHAGIMPKLAILVVGDDERTASYIRAKQKAGESIGVTVDVIECTDMGKAEAVADTVRLQIDRLNADQSVHGIILQLPLPIGIDEDELLNMVKPDKDVDGLTATNQAATEMGRELFPPATPMGIIRLLEQYNVPIAGSTVAIIGQGRLVGKPLSYMLESRDATIRTADASTTDIGAVIQGVDIVVSATGQTNLIGSGLITDDMVVVDAGLSEAGKTLVGDVTENAKKKAKLATPVPGGVGPMTVVSLLSNVVVAAELSQLH